jgi:hypothetical protein
MTNLARRDFGSGGAGRFLTKLAGVASILTRLEKGDMLFLQYPMKKFYYMACLLAKWKGASVVTVIHDLGAFRRHKLTAEGENRRLSMTDFLIVHNPTMEQYLRRHGFSGGIHRLQIFDYLSPSAVRTATAAEARRGEASWRLVYAGNLGRWRNAFLYRVPAIADGWTMDLYGRGFEPEATGDKTLTYHGFIDSDDFIAGIEADFGLVWDGDSTEECTGDWGEYLRINDPHKTSFYLRAGIPVIVWSQAAMAPFILEQNVGIAVDGIDQIADRLASITPETYRQMKQNAVDMSQRLNHGYYIKAGLQAADEYLTAENRF